MRKTFWILLLSFITVSVNAQLNVGLGGKFIYSTSDQFSNSTDLGAGFAVSAGYMYKSQLLIDVEYSKLFLPGYVKKNRINSGLLKLGYIFADKNRFHFYIGCGTGIYNKTFESPSYEYVKFHFGFCPIIGYIQDFSNTKKLKLKTSLEYHIVTGDNGFSYLSMNIGLAYNFSNK